MILRRTSTARILTALILLTFAAPPAIADPDWDHTYADYGAVLQKFVTDNGRVNYAGLKLGREGLDDFVKAVDKLDDDDYEVFTKDQKRAFWINVHNALVLRVVIDNYPIPPKEGYSRYPESSPMNIEGAWREEFDSPVGDVTLSRIEGDILPDLAEPYFVFAISKGTIGGPRLAREPYTPENLTAQLETAAERYFRDENHVNVQDEQLIRLSNFLRIHAKRFVGRHYRVDQFPRRDKTDIALMNMILKYGDPNLAAPIRKNLFRIEWVEPDKTLNDVLAKPSANAE